MILGAKMHMRYVLKPHDSFMCRASQGSKPPSQEEIATRDNVLLTALGLTLVFGLALKFVDIDFLEDFLYGDGTSGYSDGLSSGEVIASSLWAVSLYFTSPVQQLLLFLGRIYTERPSDWVIKKVGELAGKDVEGSSYKAPPAVMAATFAIFALSGFTVTKFIDWSCGDSTWSVSTGLGSFVVAGVYELGRPLRLSNEEVNVLEDQFQDFARWADNRLERSGRCHFTEINTAFRTEPGNNRYRTEDGVSNMEVRNMIANWAPTASRTSAGYYKGLSVKPRIDPFSGK